MMLCHFPALLLTGLLLGSASHALAADGPRGERSFTVPVGEHWQGRQGPRRNPEPNGMDNPERRSWDEGREARREARRQWLNSRQVEEGGRPGEAYDGGNDAGRHRLSPEERSRLRQDINEAGRDMYPRDGRPPFPRP